MAKKKKAPARKAKKVKVKARPKVKPQAKPKVKVVRTRKKVSKPVLKPGKEPKGDKVPEAQLLKAVVYEDEVGMVDGEIQTAWFVEYRRVNKGGKNKVRLDAENLAEAKFEAASLLGISETDIGEE